MSDDEAFARFMRRVFLGPPPVGVTAHARRAIQELLEEEGVRVLELDVALDADEVLHVQTTVTRSVFSVPVTGTFAKDD